MTKPKQYIVFIIGRKYGVAPQKDQSNSSNQAQVFAKYVGVRSSKSAATRLAKDVRSSDWFKNSNDHKKYHISVHVVPDMGTNGVFKKDSTNTYDKNYRKNLRTRKETVFEADFLLSSGESPRQIAAQMGMSLDAIEQAYRRSNRHNIANVFGREAQKERRRKNG